LLPDGAAEAEKLMFYNHQLFPFARGFEGAWETIRDEYRALEAPVLDIHRIGDVEPLVERLRHRNGWTPSWQVGSREPNHNWLTFGLYYKGVVPDGNEKKLPVTTDLVRRLPGCKVAALSLMRPTSFLAPHAHDELGRGMLTYHLGLEVAPNCCFIVVDGVAEQENCGKSIVFDGSHEHFAINMSKADRAILYVEFDSRVALV
jgi:beta-hydroxylase